MNWYYVENGQQKGPVTQDQLDELARQGTIKADTLTWTDGMANWLPYSQARPGSGAAPAVPVGGSAYPGMSGGGSEETARKKVGAPAVGLIIASVVGILAGVFGLLTPLWIGWLIKMVENMQLENPGVAQLKAMAAAGSVWNIFFGVLNIGVAIFVIVAAVKMRNLKGHGLVVTAAILSMLPYISGCCCVGLPFGIWALVVLLNAEVKSSFR